MKTLNKYFLGNLYTPANNVLLEQIESLILPNTERCAKRFYTELLADDATKLFLSNDLVKERLSRELAKWIGATLTIKSSFESTQEVVAMQRHVGEVHARVNVPMTLVNSAMIIVKEELFLIILASPLTSDNKTQAVILINKILDASLSLINEAYLEGRVANERSAQEFRSRTTAHELAIEIERVKGSFFSWLTEFMTALLTDQTQLKTDLAKQDFGLWIRHKLDFICSSQPVVSSIKDNLDQIQIYANEISALPKESRGHKIKLINDLTNECGWFLSSIADKNIEDSTREDGLTSLIERRFMAPILQKETQMAIKLNAPYTLIMLDVDNFKSINDIYGHPAGDTVLSNIGRGIKRTLQITDYAFRYGGEEFLILLPETKMERARIIAQQILTNIRALKIQIENGRHIGITASIGLAEFSGHPDFMQLINQADQNLYQAKHNGKDQAVG
ncbi:GGDEF domain-containing protein [Thiomicrorhabdus aquaedulcis]|uniref:GGDEF domain-containing protein n=1 Tax=Thiomicrorhabdus aquaedulcis TaxID=2211106 RepID=UPI000FDAA4A0|nr:GGDEF domain-containing protein [Thiomicrorhabdus aquaedulcis]